MLRVSPATTRERKVEQSAEGWRNYQLYLLTVSFGSWIHSLLVSKELEVSEWWEQELRKVSRALQWRRAGGETTATVTRTLDHKSNVGSEVRSRRPQMCTRVPPWSFNAARWTFGSRAWTVQDSQGERVGVTWRLTFSPIENR